MSWLLFFLAAVALAAPIVFLDGIVEVDQKYIDASPLLQQGLNGSEVVPYSGSEFLWLVEMIEERAYSREVERVLRQYEMATILGMYANYLLLHSPLLDYEDELADYVKYAMDVHYPDLMYTLLQLRRAGCISATIAMIVKNSTVMSELDRWPNACSKIMTLPVPPGMPVYVATPQYGSSVEASAYQQAIVFYFQRMISLIRDYSEEEGWDQKLIYLSGVYQKENYYLWLTVSLYSRPCMSNRYSAGTVCQ